MQKNSYSDFKILLHHMVWSSASKRFIMSVINITNMVGDAGLDE